MIPFYDLFHEQIKQMMIEEKKLMEKNLGIDDADLNSGMLNSTTSASLIQNGRKT